MMKAGEKGNRTWAWVFAIFVIIFLALISMILASVVMLFSGTQAPLGQGNVAVIKISGVIVTEASEESYFGETVVSADDITGWIKDAADDPEIKAVLFEINSPGGSAVASDEIGTAIKSLNKTKVAFIREVGASGGYWVASACDYIVASRMAVTGSIGVISSYLEFNGLMDKYGVNYRRLVAGKYKDIGTPLKNMTPEEEALFNDFLGKVHTIFIDEVASNRNLPEDKVREVATGMFYIASDAKDLGLIDEVGTKDDAIKMIEKMANITAETVVYEKEPSFLEVLMGTFSEQSYSIGRGIGDSVSDPKAESAVKAWT